MDEAMATGSAWQGADRCPSCGAENQAQSLYCTRCHAPITRDPARVAAQTATSESAALASPALSGAGAAPTAEPRSSAVGSGVSLSPASGMELLRAAPSSVVVMDTNGRITMLNAAAERLLSANALEAEGKLYPDVFGPSLSNKLMALFLRAARPGGAGAAHAIAATLPSGRRAALRANAGPLRDSAGAVTGIFFVADETIEGGAAGEEREARLRQALQRYVGDAIASRIADHPSFVGIGGVRQVVSVLHADVRGYTTLAEEMDPEQVSNLLIRFHGTAVAALVGEGATIDRYIGDAILAMWNAPAPQAAHARLLIQGALAMRRVTQDLGRELEYGIGLHTGEAVVGNLGSAEYMHYTAIGDTVNVAARLQSLAPAGGIVCSAATLAAAGEGVRVTPLGDLAVKGRKSLISAFVVEDLEA